jgi:hypothetical protein
VAALKHTSATSLVAWLATDTLSTSMPAGGTQLHFPLLLISIASMSLPGRGSSDRGALGQHVSGRSRFNTTT